MPLVSSHPLQPLLDLPEVTGLAESARSIAAQVHRHKNYRRTWEYAAHQAGLRSAVASAQLAGGSGVIPHDPEDIDPTLAGALRVAQYLQEPSGNSVASIWLRSPLQVIAQLHTYAAAGLVTDPELLGRPHNADGIGERLAGLSEIITEKTPIPAPVLAAVVHGEILALHPFSCGTAVVARACSRLVCLSSGFDPHSLLTPELYWLQHANQYALGIEKFATGTPEGVGEWIRFCCKAFIRSGNDALKIANSAG